MKTGIDRLGSGGLITNYHCTSRCGHCLYRSSSDRSHSYIDRKTLDAVLPEIRRLGCHSLHIGGGEPFLNRDGLLQTVQAFRRHRMEIDYIETNSSWCKNTPEDITFLKKLRRNGLSALLVSISPFHNEYVPLQRVKDCLQAARTAGLSLFPWIQDFYTEIDALDPVKTHSLDEYAMKYGPGYLSSLPGRYGLTMRGRALGTYIPMMESRPYEEILRGHGPCRELHNVSHFHVDLEGRYVPGLCAGFSIPVTALGKAFSGDRFPLLARLAANGITALFSLAHEQYGFIPRETYVSKCDFCEDIRRYLMRHPEALFSEIAPDEFYSIG